MDSYRELRVLQRGSYGVVSLVEDIRSGRRYAAKCIAQDSPDLCDAAATEIAVHRRLRHRNVLELVTHFENEGQMCLILELCAGGDLHEAIRRGEYADHERLRRLMLQLVDVVEYAHSRGVYHRDIKPENVLLARNGNVKLGDWGLATMTRQCSDFNVGSEQYMAPECFDKQTGTYDAAQADVWALGVVLLNVLFGRNPFKVANQSDRLFTDFASCRETLYDVFPALGSDVFAVLRHCLTIDPANRSLRAMRSALLDVQTWTTDDEIEMYGMTPPVASGIPITIQNRKPFRVPTAVAGTMTPVHSWDRRKQFTPPASRAPFATVSAAQRRSWRPSRPLEPPALLEEDEADASSDDAVFAMDDLDSALPTGSTPWHEIDDDENRDSMSVEPKSRGDETLSKGSEELFALGF